MKDAAERPRSNSNNVLALFVGFTWLDAGGGSLAPFSEFILALLISGLAAQFALAATWAVLAPRPLIERTLASVLTASWWLGAGVLPAAFVAPADEGFFTQLFCFLLWLLLGMQVPLWTCRLTFGWHVVQGAEPGPAVPARQFGMRQLLAAVTTVALWLGLLRLSMAAVAQVAVVLMILSLWFGLLMIPSVFVALGARSITATSISLAFALGVLGLVVAGAVGGAVGGIDAFLAVAFHGIFLAVFHGSLLAARHNGYVLRWDARRARMAGP